MKAEDKCSVCTYPLMSRAFYLFPCGHKFHMDCLIAEVSPLGNFFYHPMRQIQAVRLHSLTCERN